MVDTTNALAFGSYLAVFCTGCRKPGLKGGEPVAPGYPQVPDITFDRSCWALVTRSVFAEYTLKNCKCSGFIFSMKMTNKKD